MARLDTELVRRGLARARGHAAELVLAGRVLVDGRVAHKASQQVRDHSVVEVVPGPGPDYVGRGAHKLAGVLDDLELSHPPGVRVDGFRCLDAGASTGGFTQVLLERGARQVLAVDVGHDQLAPALRDDSRVLDLSGTTVRGLTPSAIGGPVDLVVGDLSFISLTLVLDDLRGLVRPGGELVLLVKPQFEVGRERLGSGGVVRDPALRCEAVQRVCEVATEVGLGLRAVRASRWPGPSGNVEYFVWLVPAPVAASVPARPSGGGAGSAVPEVIDLTDAAASARAASARAGSGTIVAGPMDAAPIASAVRAAVEEGPA
jgi:23S rRNA (cytidine1920-2'-O)/16S rRNA (cytidine1409-2'-O)-methyltransferase